MEPRQSAVQEELRVARGELANVRRQLGEARSRVDQLERELSRTRNQLLESWEQLRQLRATLSWRVTRPLRGASRVLRR